MRKQQNSKALLWAGGLVGVGLLAVGGSSRGRQTLKQVGESMAEAVEEGFDWIGKIVARTSQHEGGYDSLNLNRDGAGLSFGILQWSQRTGSLGSLLREMHLADPQRFAATFGPSWQALLEATARGSLEPVAGAVLWQEPWVSRFRAAGDDAAFRAVQDRLAAGGDYMKAAIQAAKIMGVATERAVSLAYDTAVQQGPGTATKTAERVRTALQGRVVPMRDVLLTFVQHAAARFRSTTEPTRPLNKHLTWKKVGNEWHAFAGSIDLFADITRRRTALVDDPALSDVPIRLA